jgi:hypothetical protein
LQARESGDVFARAAAERLSPLVRQAEMLAAQYDAVVANPPYMGIRAMDSALKSFVTIHFTNAKSDLFACFIERGYTLAKWTGHLATVTMQSWMFLSSYDKMREHMLPEKTIRTARVKVVVASVMPGPGHGRGPAGGPPVRRRGGREGFQAGHVFRAAGGPGAVGKGAGDTLRRGLARGGLGSRPGSW